MQVLSPIASSLIAIFYNEGEGLFPLPLNSPATLLADRLEKIPALTVDAEHPIFARIFGGTLNNWLQSIDVSRYYATSSAWDEAADPNVSVLAQLRNGAPWMVEKKLGKGKVLAVLSTAAPQWHNWGLADPSFVLWALDTLVYLGATKTFKGNREAGEVLQANVPSTTFRPLVNFTTPRDHQEGRSQSVQVAAVAIGPDPTKRVADFGKVQLPGVYEARRSQLNGEVVLECTAFNAPDSESDLRVVSEGQMRGLLGEIPYQYRSADTFFIADKSEAGFPLAEQWWFFVLLAAILVVEQWIAYGASYHRSRKITNGRVSMIFGVLLATVSGLRTYFEFGRVLSGPWDWILPLVVLFFLIWNTVVMVRRDCEELGGQRAAVLIGLRHFGTLRIVPGLSPATMAKYA